MDGYTHCIHTQCTISQNKKMKEAKIMTNTCAFIWPYCTEKKIYILHFNETTEKVLHSISFTSGKKVMWKKYVSYSPPTLRKKKSM